jgi:hypothetical protein
MAAVLTFVLGVRRVRAPKNKRYAFGLVGEWSSLKESNGGLYTQSVACGYNPSNAGWG